MSTAHVRVGIGVIIQNTSNNILIGKRLGTFAPYYSIPGGHIEIGESFEQAATREIQEETGLLIKNPRVIALSNNLETFKNEGKHYISVILFTNDFEGTVQNLEPEKCSEWIWTSPLFLPKPHFEASEIAVNCFLENCFYKTI